MNTKTIDCTGSNPRPIPVPLDGSPKTRPLRSALLPTLVFGSLSMLAAFFPGASSAQQPKPAVECIADIPTDHIGDWENECDDELVFKGSSTRSVASFSACQDRSGSDHEIAKDETYTTATGDNPQTLCVQYKSAATQYSSGYAACVIASGNCDVDDDDDGVDYITAAELPEATINMTNAVIDEGSTATMTVSLNFTDSQASISSDVVLDITSGAATKVTVSPATLTFTDANKSSPQQITLTALQDSDSTHDIVTITATPKNTSGAYAAAATARAVLNDDEDTTRPALASDCVDSSASDGNARHTFTRKSALPSGCRPGDTIKIIGQSANRFGARWLAPDDEKITLQGGNNEAILLVRKVGSAFVSARFCFEYEDHARQRASGYASCPSPSTVGRGTNGHSRYTSNKIGFLVSSENPIRFNEGATLNFTVKIDSVFQSSGNVEAEISIVTAGSDITIDTDSSTTGNQNTLTFTPSTLGTAQTVSITAPRDDDASVEINTLRIEPTSPNDYDIARVDIPVRVIDIDTPDGAIVTTGGVSITVPEGGAKSTTFDVHLTSEDTAKSKGENVIELSVDNSDIIIDTDPATAGNQTSLTFAEGLIGFPQTVTVTASLDADTTNDSGTITLSPKPDSGSINLTTVTKAVIVMEPPTGAIETIPSGTFTVEEGLRAILGVKLSAAPTSPTSTVEISKTHSDLSFDKSTLTFTPDNYDEPQDVGFVAARDSDFRNESDTITLTFEGGLNDVPDLEVPTVIAEPPAGTVVVSPAANLKINEGTVETIGVRLSAAPNTLVSVKITNTNSEIDIDTDPDRAGNQDTLFFTEQNHAVIQPVRVTAESDNDRDGGTDVITFSTTGGINSDDVTLDVEILDNDVPEGAIEVSPSNFAIREGFSGTLNVKLSKEPNRDVIVSVVLSKIHSGVTVSPQELTYKIADWQTPQTITVSAGPDRNTYNDTNTLTFSANAGGGLIAPDVIKTFNVYDAEISPAAAHRCVGYYELDGGGIGFGGHDSAGNSRFTCAAGNVRVYVNYYSLTSCSPQSHEIKPGANGGREFDIRTSGIVWCAEYSNSETQRQSGFESCRVLSCPGANSSGRTMEIGSTIVAGGISLSTDSIDLDEHERRSFDVMLQSDPTLPVIVYLKSSDPHVSLDPSSLDFNRGNWFTGQTVTVTSEGDKDSDDHQGQITLEAVGGNYHGLRTSLSLSVTDNESTVAPDPDDPRYWPIQSHAFAIPPESAQDEATIRIRCRESTPCIVYLDCSDQENGSLYRGILSSRGQPVATIPGWGTRTIEAEDIVSITGRSWSGKGRLACAFRSQETIATQIWTRSGDGVLVNNSDAIRSALTDGGGYQADIESIPAPGGDDETNIRIRCTAVAGEHCTGTRFTCYGDDGTMHDGTIGTVRRLSVRHLQTSELSDIINHRWRGMGLSCEVTSDHPFSIQVLTRTGGGGALVNNSATGG